MPDDNRSDLRHQFGDSGFQTVRGCLLSARPWRHAVQSAESPEVETADDRLTTTGTPAREGAWALREWHSQEKWNVKWGLNGEGID